MFFGGGFRRVQAAAVGQYCLLDGLAEVGPQVVAVGDLDRVRGAGSGADGIVPAAVAAGDAHARMPAQPVGEGVRAAVGQHVDRSVRGHIEQDCRVVLAFLDREVVDAEHLRRLHGAVWDAADDP
nr:hypothetical protein [Dactylosporangium matsuzakiense]